MPQGKSVENEPKIQKLYYWLSYIDLEMALKDYAKNTRYGHKRYKDCVQNKTINDMPIKDVESMLKEHKELPFFMRAYRSLFTPIDDLRNAYMFYRVRRLSYNLAIRPDFNPDEWQKSLEEMKLLMKENKQNKPFIDFSYYYETIAAFIDGRPRKDKKDIFHNVKYITANQNEWQEGRAKSLNDDEKQIAIDINKATKYLSEQSIKSVEILNASHKTNDDTTQHCINDFKNSVASYYNNDNWSKKDKSSLNLIVKVLSDYLNESINYITTFTRCYKAFCYNKSKSKEFSYKDPVTSDIMQTANGKLRNAEKVLSQHNSDVSMSLVFDKDIYDIANRAPVRVR